MLPFDRLASALAQRIAGDSSAFRFLHFAITQKHSKERKSIEIQ